MTTEMNESEAIVCTLSLWDFYAAVALLGLISSSGPGGFASDYLARTAHQIARAMMEERKKHAGEKTNS